MQIKSIKQLKNLKNKAVLVRCDFDIPIKEIKKYRNKKIKIIDDTRLKACLPTIEYLLKKKCQRIILMGHLGRPGGKMVKNLSLKPVKNKLKKILRKDLRFKIYDLKFNFIKKIPDSRFQIPDSQIAMLENLRFYPEEQKNDKNFAKKLSSLADIYVNEAFAVSHRSAASVDAIQNYLPNYAGLHLEQEIKNLSYVLQKPKRPLVVIIGGAKIETKLPVIKNFIKTADYILIGGAVANMFFKVMGYEVGKSLVDDKYLVEARRILKKSETSPDIKSGSPLRSKNSKLEKDKNYSLLITHYSLLLPVDAITSKGKIKSVDEIKKNEYILDIGPQTRTLFCDKIKKARTIVWNGPMGYFEEKRFAKGTNEIAKSILENKKAKSVIGGGETIQQLSNKHKAGEQQLTKNIFISTGGGAMLEFLAGKKLPGINTLIKRG